MSRTKAREKAFQTLFQLDLNDCIATTDSDLISDLYENAYTKLLVEGVRQNKQSIDTIISTNLENWTLDRLASVEKTVLRIAIYEIKYAEDVPFRVSINEAVQLANVYGDEKSGKFVNGVLSKIIA
ncbi:transcription antitermination factor NusB [Virgibacillus sp. W0430]|uniref:transcription antitermination factor NusB n=1 Tax=Virgibacillus sp. W0430 TaxID=3391580 RepID=UPI003F47CFE3